MFGEVDCLTSLRGAERFWERAVSFSGPQTLAFAVLGLCPREPASLRQPVVVWERMVPRDSWI